MSIAENQDDITSIQSDSTQDVTPATPSSPLDTTPTVQPASSSQALLTPAHHTMLHVGSGLPDAVINARGYRSFISRNEILALGFPEFQARTAPALGIPLWNVKGQQDGWQLRPDTPRHVNGKPVKYETRFDSRASLDIHPLVQHLLRDVNAPVIVTEGIKKADKLASLGACVIALSGGVWGFGKKVPLPAWDDIPLQGRQVIAVYDSDVMTKISVKRALNELCTFLRDTKGAIPHFVDWTEDYQQQKWGVDDFLVAGHSLADLQAMMKPWVTLDDAMAKIQRTPEQVAEQLLEDLEMLRSEADRRDAIFDGLPKLVTLDTTAWTRLKYQLKDAELSLNMNDLERIRKEAQQAAEAKRKAQAKARVAVLGDSESELALALAAIYQRELLFDVVRQEMDDLSRRHLAGDQQGAGRTESGLLPR